MSRKFLSIVLALLVSAPAFAQTIEGPVRDREIKDGDTFNYVVRLWGVDTPESKQLCHNQVRGCYTCGQDAKKALQNKIGGNVTRCEPIGEYTYGRIVAVCYVGETEINLWLLEQGLAVAYKSFLNKIPEKKPLYLAAEQSAKAANKGIWSGTFIPPSKWRRGERLQICDPDG